MTSILEAQSRAQGRLHVTKQQSKTNVERNIAILSSTKFVPETPDKNTLNMDFNFWGGEGGPPKLQIKATAPNYHSNTIHEIYHTTLHKRSGEIFERRKAKHPD